MQSASLKWILLLMIGLLSVGCAEDPPQSNSTSSGDSADHADAADTHTQDTADSQADSSATCGNGQIEGDEECDEGPQNSDTLADACRSNCKAAACGDGVIDARLNETCDDGNSVNDDACNNLCRLSSCGDGALQAGEQCDEGSQNSDTRPDACRSNCTNPRCGDLTTDSSETCDDGNTLNNDACLSCVVSTCGDGFIRQNVETCDDQNAASLDGCSNLCRTELGFDCQGEPSVCATTCGDGIIAGLEACDDQNTADGDYCAADCAAITGRCGDNITQSNEVCDDGNTLNGDLCSANCQQSLGSCGDGVLQNNEVCDDGNIQSGDYCAANCQSIIGACGDGVTQTNEQCDDANATVGDYCSNSCVITGFCGDGVIQIPAGEACDDGDNQSGDGCAANCTLIEPGWICPGTPSFCSPILCAANQYVQNNACTACPAGSTNTSGDNANGSDTACDPTLCAADQYVQSNTCTACPPGTSNPPGDDASGSDTACDTMFCLENQYVQSNACIACPSGSTNAPGDDASGTDTLCDPTLCAENQHVQSNACTPCGIGDINDPGDDASGGDTICDQDPCFLVLGVLCADFEEAYVKASNTGSNDNFGFVVSLDGDTLAVAASTESSAATGINGDQTDNSASISGAVYIFVRSGSTWTQQAYLKASNTNSMDYFGISVSLDGDTLAVGASQEDSIATGVNGNQADNSAANSGAVYVFTRSGSTWTQQAYLKASNTGGGDSFGSSIALDGDTLAVGAVYEDSFATGINGNQADNSMTNSGAVYIFVRAGSTWAQQAYLKASNTGSNDQFGVSVTLNGDTLAVGAYLEDSIATGVNGNQADNAAADSGAVYVFTRSGSTWAQQAYLKASNTQANDSFGWSLSLSTDTLAVGANGEDSAATGINGDQTNNSASNSGAVYVFTRAGSAWTQQAYLKASNTDVDDSFGQTVALDGDILAVGAPNEDSVAVGLDGDQTNNVSSSSGAVYVFTWSGSAWTPQAYLKASNTESTDSFGRSIALSAHTLAVGANGEDSAAIGINGDQTNNSTSNSGAVYLRKIQHTLCPQNQHVQNNACVACPTGQSNTPGDDPYGPNTACEDDPCYSALGVLCADFEQAYIKASNPGGSDQFGTSIALYGDTLAVGAYLEDSSATGINGDQTNDLAFDSGAVYVFVRSGSTWTQQAYLKASNTDESDFFGISISLNGDTLAVGASGEDSFATGINGNQADNSAINSGAVYVFTRSGSTWTQQAYLKASNTGASDAFGNAVSLHADTLAVNAYFEDSSASGINGNQADNSASNSGAVYIFTRAGSTWTQQAYLKASNTEASDNFGNDLSLFGDSLAVGAFGEDSLATGTNGNQADNAASSSGAVYVFTRSGSTWTQQAYLKASNTESNDSFGWSLSLSTDTLAVGASGEGSAATGINGNQADNSAPGSGAVYVFTRAGSAWTQQAYLKASNTDASDRFGYSISLDGDILAVGSNVEASATTGLNGDQANNAAPNSGAVYVFTRAGSAWTQAAYIKSSTSSTDRFGETVSISGNTLAVGAINEDSNATGINGDQTNNASINSGAVYIRQIAP